MNKLVPIAFTVLAAIGLAGCSSTERGAAGGALVGGVVGGVATGSVAGAAIGAGVGAVGGALLGSVAGNDSMCWYEDRYGRTYRAECPQTYHRRR